ncbi:GNAT family N-acetyltransferase [Limoniibacter endophyticus]|uniref:GCN5 family N-acetyltransferase n=1 Tax=Limoniibacter endophyticus TaxID=1565040 RepID=A0A8J3GHT0_9HYPH|nr:GNAT family N-acetyltransferase [Limoniibacter endophyticus]GHC76813.1 GCN5 family N-acetyltransferase [Limoniibacter endophyticus]
MSDILIRPLEEKDHADWKRLWTNYLIFYKASVSEEVYATTWERLIGEGEFEPNGFLAFIDGRAVGLVHYIYHRSCWSLVNNCYLQDLFADASTRGKGVGSKLIKAVQDEAGKLGIKNVYWMTKEDNAVARSLYDKVATRTGFIEYDLL